MNTSSPSIPMSPHLGLQGGLQASRSGALASHLRACAQARGRWFGLRCVGELIHAAIAPRFCTTVLVAAGLIALLAN